MSWKWAWQQLLVSLPLTKTYKQWGHLDCHHMWKVRVQMAIEGVKRILAYGILENGILKLRPAHMFKMSLFVTQRGNWWRYKTFGWNISRIKHYKSICLPIHCPYGAQRVSPIKDFDWANAYLVLGQHVFILRIKTGERTELDRREK